MAEHPWLEAYPTGVDWHESFEPLTLHALVEDAAKTYPDRVYMDFLGKKTNYRDFAKLVDRAAIGFQRLGVKKGVHVGIFMPNCPQYLITLFGISKAGGTAVSFSPLYSENELFNQVEDAEITIMVTLSLELLYPKIKKLLPMSCIKHLIVGNLGHALPFPQNLLFPIVRRKQIARLQWDDQHIHFDDLLAKDGVWEDPGLNPREDVAMLQYTGGTTGVPKGAMLTHANLTINTQQAVAGFRDLRPGVEVVHGVLPFFHIFALVSVVLSAAACGATIVMQPRFKLEDVLDDLENKGITLLPAVPTMLTAINQALEEKPRTFPALKLVVSGGAALPVEVLRKFESMTNAHIREGYGLTETSPVVALTPPDNQRREGAIGQPLPGTILTIVDAKDSSKVMPLGETGELAVEGPQVMKGYWRAEEASAAIIQHGRLLTGDIAYMDAQGFVFIVDRKKETIKVSGYNVFPRMIEEAIYTHPSVKDAAVIGVPDTYRGESPKAFVVLKTGATPVSEPELLAFLKTRIGKHEMPEEIEFRDDLPKSPIGKILKKELMNEEKAKQNKA